MVPFKLLFSKYLFEIKNKGNLIKYILINAF